MDTVRREEIGRRRKKTNDPEAQQPWGLEVQPEVEQSRGVRVDEEAYEIVLEEVQKGVRRAGWGKGRRE